MALKDTTWVWDTSTSAPKYTNAHIVSKTSGVERSTSGADTVTRIVTNTTYEWVSVTKGAALAFDSKIAADSTNTTMASSISEENRIVGAYNVTLVVNSSGGWN